MHLDGTYSLQASKEEVWSKLLDPKVLERVIPGIKTLESLGDDKYKAVSEVKMGPVSGSFKGSMEVLNKIEGEGFTLKMKQNSRMGNVSAQGTINLKEISSRETEVLFSGDAKLTGTLARTGQRVLSGVANTLTKQFFTALEKEVVDETILKQKNQAKPGFWKRFLLWLKRIFGPGNQKTD